MCNSREIKIIAMAPKPYIINFHWRYMLCIGQRGIFKIISNNIKASYYVWIFLYSLLIFAPNVTWYNTNMVKTTKSVHLHTQNFVLKLVNPLLHWGSITRAYLIDEEFLYIFV